MGKNNKEVVTFKRGKFYDMAFVRSLASVLTHNGFEPKTRAIVLDLLNQIQKIEKQNEDISFQIAKRFNPDKEGDEAKLVEALDKFKDQDVSVDIEKISLFQLKFIKSKEAKRELKMFLK